MYLLEGLRRMVCATLLLVYKPEIQVRVRKLSWGLQRGNQLFWCIYTGGRQTRYLGICEFKLGPT